MKTIAYEDKGNPGKLYLYNPKEQADLFSPRPLHATRLCNGLADIKHTGNINVYLVRGRKIRFLFSRGL